MLFYPQGKLNSALRPRYFNSMRLAQDTCKRQSTQPRQRKSGQRQTAHRTNICQEWSCCPACSQGDPPQGEGGESTLAFLSSHGPPGAFSRSTIGIFTALHIHSSFTPHAPECQAPLLLRQRATPGGHPVPRHLAIGRAVKRRAAGENRPPTPAA